MNSNRKKLEEDYRAFYSGHKSVDSLMAVGDAVCAAAQPIYGVVFSVNESFQRLRQSATEGRRRLRGFTISDRSPHLLGLPRSSENPLRHLGAAKVYLLPDPDSDTVTMMALGDDFKDVWQEFQQYFGRDITLSYLNTTDFKDAFHRLTITKPANAVRVQAYTSSVLEEENEMKTRREWFSIPKPVSQFFAEIAQERQCLRSLEVVVSLPATTHGRIRRDFTFSCQSHIHNFLQEIVGSFRAAATKNRSLLQGRSVSDSQTKTSKPLRILYDSRVFDDKSQNHRLIKVLSGMPNAAISVFHPNPFLHASVIDYSDGSSYTIWITDSSAISIIPGVKSTAQSLGRLCNHINEFFGEGDIREIDT